MYQFLPSGPVFTHEHQFLSNLTNAKVGVVSKEALISQHPQLADADIIVMDKMDKLLQLNSHGNITPETFEIAPYKQMPPSTLVYFPITTGLDGSYVVDNFVSRDVLPDFEKWPWTYGTIGIILKSCQIDYQYSVEGDKQLLSLTTGNLCPCHLLDQFLFSEPKKKNG